MHLLLLQSMSFVDNGNGEIAWEAIWNESELIPKKKMMRFSQTI